MKKMTLLLLGFVAMLALTACGEDTETDTLGEEPSEAWEDAWADIEDDGWEEAEEGTWDDLDDDSLEELN